MRLGPRGIVNIVFVNNMYIRHDCDSDISSFVDSCNSSGYKLDV